MYGYDGVKQRSSGIIFSLAGKTVEAMRLSRFGAVYIFLKKNAGGTVFSDQDFFKGYLLISRLTFSSGVRPDKLKR